MEIFNATSCFLFQSFLVSFLLLILHANSNPTLRERSTFVVHMDKSQMPKVLASHHWYTSTLNSIKADSLEEDSLFLSPSSFFYSYDNAAHGFSAVLSPIELENLKNSPGFLSAYQDHSLTIDTTRSSGFLSLNPVTGLLPVPRFGEDVIIGVVDSGVWPESESFYDDGMTAVPSRWKGICEEGRNSMLPCVTEKLIGARYYNKGVLVAKPGAKIDMKSPRYTDGHGTHTSSTAAGNYVKGANFFGYATGKARGVAPSARVAAYKVLWNAESYATDALAGIEQAIADGVDVISVSMGSDGVPLYQDPIAIASFAAMEKGVFVSASAGNKGPSLESLHNGIPWVLTVGAGTIDRSFGGRLTLGNGQIITGWTLFPASPFIENQPLIYNNNFSACNSVELLSKFSPGSVILCDHSEDVFEQIATIAELPDVKVAIFISDNPQLYQTGSFPCPGVVISPSQARVVVEYAKASKDPTVSIKFQENILHTKPAPAAAIYSARGPSKASSGILKPDIIAPGTLVLAAWIPTAAIARIGSSLGLSGDFSLVSGTSMACPHAAAVAALLKGTHPDWSSAAIRSAMMTTANPLDNTRNPIKDEASWSPSSDFEDATFDAATPLAIGAGQIDPNRALDPGLVYDATPQDYVNLVCTMNYTNEQILSITRSRSYNCSNPSPDLNYPSFISLYGKESPRKLVQTFHRTVTNVGAAAAATYKVKVTAPKGSNVRVSPETLVFGQKFEMQSYRVTVSYRRDPHGTVSFGSLVWVEHKGGHKVRSPIVISPIPEDFF